MRKDVECVFGILKGRYKNVALGKTVRHLCSFSTKVADPQDWNPASFARGRRRHLADVLRAAQLAS